MTLYQQAPDHHVRLLEIDWDGPYAVKPKGSLASWTDPLATANSLKQRLAQPGLYMIIGDHPAHGARTLLYIGTTDNLETRLTRQHVWLRYQWRPEVFLGVSDSEAFSDKSLREDAEKLLIIAHSPAYNSRGVSRCKLSSPLRVWNKGRFFRLLPELSNMHPWYDGLCEIEKKLAEDDDAG